MKLENWLRSHCTPGEVLTYTGYAVFRTNGDFYSLIDGDTHNVLDEDWPRVSKREWDEIEGRLKGEE